MDPLEARQILSKAFSNTPDKSSLNFARSTKQERLKIIQDEKAEAENRQICACIEITRFWRGYACRSTLTKLFTKVDKNVKVSKFVINPPVTPASSVASRESKELTPRQPSPTPVKTVTPTPLIKKRGSIAKKKRKSVTKTPLKPVDITPKVSINFTKNEAAIVIQKAWRRHIDTQVFRYYQALINFHGQGDPSVMLRCINPLESQLLDSAAGIHIKFRLAGEKFPPNIYYKIFTHRPIVDMCANSPKDYTAASSKQAMGKQVHTRHLPLNATANKQAWYHRVENNGWRLVSDRLIHAAMDPTTWETSQKKVDFHYSKPVRQKDIEKKRRKKKIEWMQKMYRNGMLQSKQTDEETKDLVERAAHGLTTTISEQGEDAVMDWEIDELLQWTTALNFDDYLETWKDSATSGVSEAGIPMTHNNLNTDFGIPPRKMVPLWFDQYALTRTSSNNAQAQDPRFIPSQEENNYDFRTKNNLHKEAMVG